MTTVAPTTLAGWLESAAAAAVGSLTVGEALHADAPQVGLRDLGLPVAVVVRFGGAVSGEFAVFVDEQVAEALRTATIGSLDIADALAPALQSIATALGSGALGVAQAVDTATAISRVGAYRESGAVTLSGTSGIRAAVAVGLDEAHTAHEPSPIDRFELLRGVEMQASVELGRARLTINDLLSLRSGEVIELDRAAGELADLFVNGRLIARGEVVVVDENYGLRITQLVNDEPSR